MDLAQQLTIVIGVFGLLGAAVWALRSRGSGPIWRFPAGTAAARRLKVLERLPLTPQHSLHLVEFDGRTLVVGVSPAGCHLLISGAEKEEAR